MDLELSAPSFSALLRALIRVDLLRPEEGPHALPWDEMCGTIFSVVDAGRALRLAQACQRALARAAHEQWQGPQLEAHLLSGGLDAARAAAAGALWGKEREGALAAVQARAYAPSPALRGAPAFSVSTLTASSEGASGGEPTAMLHLDTSEGPLTVEASRGALAAATQALAQARRALGAAAAL